MASDAATAELNTITYTILWVLLMLLILLMLILLIILILLAAGWVVGPDLVSYY